jgi:phosphate starvation-inducible membrane PsiE
MRQLRAATGDLHRNMNDTADAIGAFLVDAFHLLALFAIGATTVWSAAAALLAMCLQGRASLGDILLLFIYLEIGAMVGIYFKTTRLPVRYLIYIAITALGRVLIEVVGAEHQTGMDILIIAGAILLLSFAVLVLRIGSYRFPADATEIDLKGQKERTPEREEHGVLAVPAGQARVPLGQATERPEA